MFEDFDALATAELAHVGGRLHVVDQPGTKGPGGLPPVVFVHGSPTSSLLWRRQLVALAARGRRVLAPDQLGQGASDAPDGGVDFAAQTAALRELLDARVAGPFDLVVHDWGGPVGLGACVHRWADVRRLVLVNTTFLADWREPPGWEAFVAPETGEQLIVEANAWIAGLPGVMAACAADAALYARYAAPSERVGTRRTFLRLERLEGFRATLEPVERCLRDRTPPTRIVWGGGDVYFGDESERLLAALPSAGVVHIPGGGHFPQEDAPDPTHDAILGWVEARGGG